jgi:hypothetical protein
MPTIDDYASSSNPVVDITGTTLGVIASYIPKGGNAFVQSATLVDSFLPSAVRKTLATPISDIFNQMWSVTTGANGQTMLQRATAAINSGLSSSGVLSSPSLSPLPQKGYLRALVSATDPKTFYLSFELRGIRVDGTIGIGGFEVTFDFELLFTTTIPPAPSSNFNVTAYAQITNSNSQPTNFGGWLEDIAIDLGTSFIINPLAIINSNVDGVGQGVSVDLGALSTEFNLIPSQCVT